MSKKYETDIIKSITDGTSAIQFTSASGTTLLTLDTTNEKIIAKTGYLPTSADHLANKSYVDSLTSYDYIYASETTARTFYISTTGSDATGDGSSGNPYYSIHKILSVLKPIIRNNITINVASGTYDFTSLGDIDLMKFRILDNYGFTIRNNSAIDSATNVVASGTFTSHTLLGKGAAATDTSDKALIHNNSSATYTANAYKGMILKALTGTHTLPTAANRYCAILQNGTDWVESAPMFGMSGEPYQDILNYEIRDYNVTFNFGNNRINLTGIDGYIRFYYLKITNFGGIRNSDMSFSLNTNHVLFYNCSVNYSSGSTYLDESSCSYYSQSYVNFGSGVTHYPGVMAGCSIESSATNTTMANSIMFMSSTFNYNNILCTNGTKPYYVVRLPGRLGLGTTNVIGTKEVNKLVGCQGSFFNKNLVVSGLTCGGYYITDTDLKFFLTLASQTVQGLNITLSDASYPVTFLAYEPTVGRISKDGSTEITKYYDFDASLNVTAIATTSMNYRDFTGRGIDISGYKAFRLHIISSNTTLSELHNIVACNTTGLLTVTLPATSTCTNRVYTIKNINTGSVIIDANSTELIDASQTLSINQQWQSLDLISSGSAWYII